jgi:hypothetical protein
MKLKFQVFNSLVILTLLQFQVHAQTSTISGGKPSAPSIKIIRCWLPNTPLPSNNCYDDRGVLKPGAIPTCAQLNKPDQNRCLLYYKPLFPTINPGNLNEVEPAGWSGVRAGL